MVVAGVSPSRFDEASIGTCQRRNKLYLLSNAVGALVSLSGLAVM